ncbi:hypothetical protein [Devosia sediminis]|uniref:Uncharacterized protein n=1 Tax=Devosia sediminis TaxID=2798801 RepID=A0A934MM33_9HYPH|nr:hypothetical protein [Devosia sediminis]MBJ3785281.1 hypothetical protein [Devosia sediminis]
MQAAKRLAKQRAVVRDLRTGDILYVFDVPGQRLSKPFIRLDFRAKAQALMAAGGALRPALSGART